MNINNIIQTTKQFIIDSSSFQAWCDSSSYTDSIFDYGIPEENIDSIVHPYIQIEPYDNSNTLTSYAGGEWNTQVGILFVDKETNYRNEDLTLKSTNEVFAAFQENVDLVIYDILQNAIPSGAFLESIQHERGPIRFPEKEQQNYGCEYFSFYLATYSGGY